MKTHSLIFLFAAACWISCSQSPESSANADDRMELVPEPDKAQREAWEAAKRGKQLYLENCTPCHSISDRIIGPALLNVQLRRDSAWLYRWTTSSIKLIDSGDTAAIAIFNKFNKMMQPDFKLDAVQVDDIYKYIAAESKAKY